MNINKFGRSYNLGKSLDHDLRILIIDQIPPFGKLLVTCLSLTCLQLAYSLNVSANKVSEIYMENILQRI